MDRDNWEAREEARRTRWEARQRWRQENRGAPAMAAGAMIVIVGLLLLLQNFGIVRIHDLWQYWPVIFIVLGAARLTDANSPGAIIFGSLLVAGGGLVLLHNLDIFRLNFNLLWPVILIGVGLTMLWKTFEAKQQLNADGIAVPAKADVHSYAIFGGSERRIETPDFKGGDMVAIFGGVELDLRGSHIASGQAVLEANVVFGGVELKVPETWTVDNRMLHVFGGAEDKSIPGSKPDAPERLVLTGYCMFGGVSIKN